MLLRVLETGGAWVRRLCSLLTARFRATKVVDTKYADLVRPLAGLSAAEAIEAARRAGWAERPVLDVQMIRDCLPQGDHTAWITVWRGDSGPTWGLFSEAAPPQGLISHGVIGSSTAESQHRE